MLEVRTTPIVLLVAAALGAGCERPPEAPETLDELGVYLYEHHADEGDKYLQAGLTNLDAWLADHLEETAEGYEVEGLTREITDALDGTDRPVDGIFGVTVATSSGHSVDRSATALVEVGPDEFAPDNYNSYERDYVTDPDCFVARECLWLETDEVFEGVLAMGVTSLNHAYNEYRWIEIEDGWAMAQRAWLVEPPEINMEWLQVDQQFYLNLFLPDGDGSIHLQTTWMVADQDDLPENLVMTMTIEGMRENAENLDRWLDEQ